jgi:transcriptional regulator with XRE-family HTH domain
MATAAQTLSNNLRLLRGQKNYSQQQVADDLIITRVRLAKYEEGKTEPPLDLLKLIANYYHVSVDVMIGVDLHRVPREELMKMDSNRLLMPITVDSKGRDNVELVPHKAKAGYLSNYADAEFIEGLPQIRLPLPNNGKYRAFPIEGDSMPPHKDGSFIVGKYVDGIKDIKDGSTYVVVSRDEGIVYKRLFKKGKNSIELRSDNKIYEPYDIKAHDILELWSFAASYCTKEHKPEELNHESILDMFKQLRKDLKQIN